MKKFAGFTREQVDAELKWVARHSTGYRFVGTGPEVAAHCVACQDDEWDYIKDMDILCEEGQTPAMAKFVAAWLALEKKVGWLTLDELLSEYGEEE